MLIAITAIIAVAAAIAPASLRAAAEDAQAAPTATDATTNALQPVQAQPARRDQAQPRPPRKALPADELAKLYQRKLTPAMRRTINQHLRPGNRPAQIRSNRHGDYVDLSDRASSVLIAIIDDNDNTIVADVTRPLPPE
ncbi:MAG: hypothetical protein KJO24_00135 [Gammaproteobacteria bacterium]|nr:hypothetical protein [Gammaproteobacteria bacterium]